MARGQGLQGSRCCSPRDLGRPHDSRLLRPLGLAPPQSSDARPRCRLGCRVRPQLARGLSLGAGSLLIATGIGLHNFSEGLAIGNSAAQDQIALAFALIIGFGLHNATEGFGIVAPLSGSEERPSWRFLALLGVIGGGPTFIGTLIGKSVVSEAVSVGFLALAAGSLLYVIIELMNVNRQFGHKTLVTWALLVGLFVGFGTEFVLEAAGA